MKHARLLGFLVAALMLVPFAHADGGAVSMVFTGVNGANDGHYYVSPYTGTMDGQTVTLHCDDILNEVNFGQTWQANVTNLAAAINLSDFTRTRYGGVSSSPVFGNAAMAYSEAAWLTLQFGSNPGDLVSLQYALWNIVNPGSEPASYGDVQWWLDQAAQNYGTIDAANFSIITNTDPLQLSGKCQVQEFIVQTPEPGTLGLLLCGALFLAARLFCARRLTA